MPREKRAYSEQERDELWRLWKRGDRITDIAKALERETGSLFGYLMASGGIQPRTQARNQRV